MSQDEKTLILLAHKWFEAFNEHHVEKLVSLYAENAEHFSPNLMRLHPETKGLIKGKIALRAWWTEAFERLPELRYTPLEFKVDGNTLHMCYLRQVKTEPDREVNETLRFFGAKIVFSKVN